MTETGFQIAGGTGIQAARSESWVRLLLTMNCAGCLGGGSQRAAVERSIAIAAASVSEVAPASAVGIAVHEPRMVPVVMEMLVGIAPWTDGNQDESEHNDQNGDL